VADKYLFVTQDVNLQSSGNIFLRNESQLLQSTTGTSDKPRRWRIVCFSGRNFKQLYLQLLVFTGRSGFGGCGKQQFWDFAIEQAHGLDTSVPATILASSILDGNDFGRIYQ
jgi:hypothetical protein